MSKKNPAIPEKFGKWKAIKIAKLRQFCEVNELNSKNFDKLLAVMFENAYLMGGNNTMKELKDRLGW